MLTILKIKEYLLYSRAKNAYFTQDQIFLTILKIKESLAQEKDANTIKITAKLIHSLLYKEFTLFK
jgi:hypothetical protein